MSNDSNNTNTANLNLTLDDLSAILTVLEKEREDICVQLVLPGVIPEDVAQDFRQFNAAYTKLAVLAVATGMFPNADTTEEQLQQDWQDLDRAISHKESQ